MKNKTSTFYSLVLCLLVPFGATGQQLKNQLQPETEKEAFMYFLVNFSLDKELQIERTKFPLLYISLDHSLTKKITSFIKKEDWKFENVFVKSNQESYKLVYDSFEKKMRDTDERVVIEQGNGNGIHVCYYFQRINGKWYLIKKEDLST